MIRLRPWQLIFLLCASLPCIAAAPAPPTSPVVAVAGTHDAGLAMSAVPVLSGSRTTGSQIAAARDAVMPYVVSILTVSQSFQQGEPTLSLSSGSGTIITAEGDVVTNAHVVERGKAYRVVFADGRELPAKLIGTDTLSDLAVLRVQTPKPEVFRHAEFASSNDLQAGDTVLAMGAPWGLSNSMSAGVVNNPRRLLVSLFDDEADYEETLGPDLPTGRYYAWIQHDAAIAPGNSGGPLVDRNGRIVGVNARAMIVGGDLAFAIPGPDAARVVEALIKFHRVPRAYLGFRLRSLKGTNLDHGVMLNAVDRGSPADRAGLRAGDVLLSMDGIEVNAPQPIDVPELQRQIAQMAVGKPVALVIARDGKRSQMTINTVPYPRDSGPELGFAPFGVSLQELTATMARRRGLDFDDGLLLTSLRPGGPAAVARPALQDGDVLRSINGTPLRTMADLKPWQDKPSKVESLLLGFQRDGENLVATLRPSYGDRSRTPLPELPSAWAGVEVQPIPASLAPAFGMPAAGYRVSRVYSGGPLGKAGIKVGDLITAINATPLKPATDSNSDGFDQAVRELDVGQPARFSIDHDGKSSTVNVDMAPSPIEPSGLKTLQVAKLRLQAREISFYDRVARKLPADQVGVVMDSVERGGPAGLAHLRAGDIVVSLGGRRTANLDEFSAAFEAALKSSMTAIPIHVVRGSEERILFLDRSWLSEKTP
jgi:serine protease Do